jgi:hypothetical protein
MSITAEQTDDALFSISFEASRDKESDLDRLASTVLIYGHLSHSHRLGRAPFIGKAAHDQYTTIPEKSHVVHNRLFSQNA